MMFLSWVKIYIVTTPLTPEQLGFGALLKDTSAVPSVCPWTELQVKPALFPHWGIKPQSSVWQAEILSTLPTRKHNISWIFQYAFNTLLTTQAYAE